MSLTFEDMRKANVLRCETAWHPINDWDLERWALAFIGVI